MSVYIPEAVAHCRELYASAPITDFLHTSDLIEAHAAILTEAHQRQNFAIVPQISCWHPNLIGNDAVTIFEFDFKIDDALWALSRECGYANWDEAKAKSETIDAPFENAIDQALAGNLSGLHASLNDHPQFVKQTSSFAHRATILIYMGSNGVEMWRQVVPENICEIIRMLVDLGADTNAVANVYGGQFDVLALAQSSAHPTEAGIRDELLQLLHSHCQS